eukprot:COSAG03_NODE_1898_length_3378_cov_28.274169_1_plen_99_part_00
MHACRGLGTGFNTRLKTKHVVTLLRAQGVTTEDVTTRSNEAPSLLEKVTKLVDKKDPSRVLTKLVDANGQSGHAVFIDCANQVTRSGLTTIGSQVVVF